MNKVILIFVGDIMLGRSFNQILPKRGLKWPWGDLPLDEADGVVGNLETTITNAVKKWPNKAFNYKLNPKYADTLRYANLKFVSLANNHILDYMEIGMYDTQDVLRKLGIKFAGAGRNLTAARRPTYTTIHGIRFGFIAAADHYTYWAATATDPGIWLLDDSILNDITKVKTQCDFLIVSLHWNENYVDELDESFRKMAHAIIDAGADILHGHSPHHLLPIEKYNGGIIFYSLGDLVDDYAISEKYRNDLAELGVVEFKRNGAGTKTSLKLLGTIPTIISNYQANIDYDNL